MMIRKFVDWFFSPSVKEKFYDDFNLYDRLIELEDRIKKLEEENIETTNELYRMENSLDARIDILANEFGLNGRQFES